MTLLFGVVMQVWDFVIIDEMFDREQILSHIAAMTEQQRRVHAIMTGTLDVAYPLAYGTFQAGMAYRYLGSWGTWIAPLSLICIPVDLLEGFTQVMLLNGGDYWVDLKVVVTPLKIALFTPGLLFALIALGIAGSQYFRARRAN